MILIHLLRCSCLTQPYRHGMLQFFVQWHTESTFFPAIFLVVAVTWQRDKSSYPSLLNKFKSCEKEAAKIRESFMEQLLEELSVRYVSVFRVSGSPSPPLYCSAPFGGLWKLCFTCLLDITDKGTTVENSWIDLLGEGKEENVDCWTKELRVETKITLKAFSLGLFWALQKTDGAHFR